MSEKLQFEKEIEAQIAATGQPISSLMSESGRMWYDASTGKINEPLLCAYLIDLFGWEKSGSRIKDKNGKFATPDDVKRAIAAEIGPFIPQGIARKIEPIFKLLRVKLPDEKPGFALETFTAADLAGETIPPTPFVVESLLPAGLTILAAPPKTGKSWLCLALADAVATGTAFWGYAVNSGDVLYFALEDSRARLQSRLRAIGSKMPKNLHMICRNTMCLDNGLIDQIENWIKDHADTRLIILDTLQRVKGAAQYGLDAYAADYARLAPLQELAQEKRVSVLAVHHFRKQGNQPQDDIFERLSGSTALFGASDAAWAIYGKRGAEEMNFHVTGRDVYDTEFKISFDKEKSRWRMLGDSEQLEAQRKLDEYNTSPLIQTIRELVKESGGRWTGSASLLKSEVMTRTQKLPATSDKAMYALLTELQEQLLKVDKIGFTHGNGGRQGRDYTFSSVSQTSLGV